MYLLPRLHIVYSMLKSFTKESNETNEKKSRIIIYKQREKEKKPQRKGERLKSRDLLYSINSTLINMYAQQHGIVAACCRLRCISYYFILFTYALHRNYTVHLCISGTGNVFNYCFILSIFFCEFTFLRIIRLCQEAKQRHSIEIRSAICLQKI